MRVDRLFDIGIIVVLVVFDEHAIQAEVGVLVELDVWDRVPEGPAALAGQTVSIFSASFGGVRVALSPVSRSMMTFSNSAAARREESLAASDAGRAVGACEAASAGSTCRVLASGSR